MAVYQRRREDRIRLTTEKIEAYSQVLAATDEVLLPLRQIYRDPGATFEPFALIPLLAAYSRAELVAGPMVRLMILDVEGAMLILRDAMAPEDGRPGPALAAKSDTIERLLHQVWTKRMQLLALQRKDLGVRGWPYNRGVEAAIERAAAEVTGLFPEPES